MVRDEARTVRTVVGGFTLTLAVFALAGVRLDPGANEPAAAALRLNLAAQELSRGAAMDQQLMTLSFELPLASAATKKNVANHWPPA